MDEIKSQQKKDQAGDHFSLLRGHNQCNITDEWVLTSFLDIKKCFLIFLNLAKLSPNQKWLKFDTLVPTLFIIIFNSNNNLFG